MVAPTGIAVVGVGLGCSRRSECSGSISICFLACAVARVVVGVGICLAEEGVILTDKLVLWNNSFWGSPTDEPSGY